jgi:hypothetical protein
MQWDRNEGRYTTILPEGYVAHAAKVEEGWELLVPGLDIRELIRNVHLRTWLTAQPIVERVLKAKLEWKDPHAQAAQPLFSVPEEQLAPPADRSRLPRWAGGEGKP